MSHTRIHNIWLSMRQRCEKPNCSGWQKYGAKGIRVCPEWSKFENFRDWAFANGYDEHLTLDRIDPKGNYEPSNCRWATQKVQQNNRSNNVYLTYNGERKKLEDWAKETGMSRATLYHRYKHGWNVERILKQPKRKSPTKRTDRIPVKEQKLSIMYTEEKDIWDALKIIKELPAIDFDGMEPYGKHCGALIEVNGEKAYVYRNPSGYVIDLRKTIYDETGELNSHYLRKELKRMESEIEK